MVPVTFHWRSEGSDVVLIESHLRTVCGYAKEKQSLKRKISDACFFSRNWVEFFRYTVSVSCAMIKLTRKGDVKLNKRSKT